MSTTELDLLKVPQQRRRLAALCARFGVRRLGLFGSAATGDFDPLRSDVDFIVEFVSVQGLRPAEQFFGFRDELAALFGRDVDLLERSAIRNPYLRRSIEAAEVLLYGA